MLSLKNEWNIVKMGYKSMIAEVKKYSVLDYFRNFLIFIILYLSLLGVGKSIEPIIPFYSGIISLLLIGPFFEELFKYLAVNLKMSLLYIIFFSLLEFALYVNLNIGTMGAIIFLIRTPAIIFHLYTMAQHKHGYDEAIKSDNMGTYNAIRIKYFKKSFILHFLFNLIALLYTIIMIYTGK